MMVAADAPRHSLSPTQLDDLELLGFGAFGDAAYGVNDDDLILQVPLAVAEQANATGLLTLEDPEGAPLAHLTVTDVTPNGQVAAIHGHLRAEVRRDFGHFRRFHLSPADAAAELGEHPTVVLFDRVPSCDDLAELKKIQAPLRFLVQTGVTGSAESSPTGLMRAALQVSGRFPGSQVVAFPLSRAVSDRSPKLARRALAAYAPHGTLALSGSGNLDPEAAAIIAADRPARHERGVVLLFTGLSGSGKSTIARGVHDVLLERSDRTITSLDGDVVRRNLSAGLGFSPADRETNIRRIGWVAAEISRHGGLALCSPIAPFAATRSEMRQMTAEAGGTFVMVHVATPLEECERRDRKGMYAKARRGEISEFTGISSPYEEPTDADLRVDTTGRTIEACVDDVVELLTEAGLVQLRTLAF